LAAAVVLGFWATAGPPPPTPTPPGSFSFAALGDSQYYFWEEIQFRQVIRGLNDHDLSFVVHVGDVFWRPCTDEHYRTALARLNRIRHPVVYTPGDNEWADCWEPGSGGFSPRERLTSLRRIFFADPMQSAGVRSLLLSTQSLDPSYPEFVEHAFWTQAGVVFLTTHLIGSDNGLGPRPERSAEDDEEVKRRTEAAAAWIEEGFKTAVASQARAVVIAFHGAPPFDRPAGHPARQVFEPFLATLEEEAGRFGGPVLVVHGDDHVYTVDQPVSRRTTGQPLATVTRLMVPGSPAVGWVRVVVTPGAEQPFAFQQIVVPRWKYW
jgi:hypothetical protein